MTTRTLVALVMAASAAHAAAGAQPPRIVNGRVTTRSVAGLPDAFRSAVDSNTSIGWIGYRVPMVAGERTMCCSHWGTSAGTVVTADGSTCCGACRLEPSTAASSITSGQPGAPIRLEGASAMIVLFRVVSRQVERVRIFSEDCQLDAGGRDLVWLTGVTPAESIALLESLATGPRDRRDRIVDGAVSAIALHEDGAADAALERLLGASQPEQLRAKVPFWLGNARAGRGLEILRRLLENEPSREVKKKAAFGVAQSREPAALTILIETARTNPDAAVRGEAIFWLAQKAGSKAAAAITERIEQDPETEVKKRAVFALSQLPKDEGVPLLIRVARTHSNPAVRKQAMFWLGQSKDPRALDFFAEILR